jgi:hypothetical protein
VFYGIFGFSVAEIHQLAEDQSRLAAVQHGSVQLFLTEHAVAPVGAVVYANTRGVDALNAAATAHGLSPTFGPADRFAFPSALLFLTRFFLTIKNGGSLTSFYSRLLRAMNNET